MALGVGQPRDGPNRAGAVLSPEDLGRPLDAGFQLARLGTVNVGRCKPVLIFLNTNASNRDSTDAGGDDAPVLGRLQEDDESAPMFFGVGNITVENGT